MLPPAFPRGVLSGQVLHRSGLGLPTALVLASNDVEFARQAALHLHNPRLRIYTSSDVAALKSAGG